jgi:hypothetical protein
MAEDLRARPASEPLWEAILKASLAQLEPGSEVTAHPVPDRDTWVAGVRLMVTSPALQAEMIRAGATAETSVAAAVAERTGTEADALYPKLVAAAVMAATNVAMAEWLRRDARADIRALLSQSLTQISAGLPPPQTRQLSIMDVKESS